MVEPWKNHGKMIEQTGSVQEGMTCSLWDVKAVWWKPLQMCQVDSNVAKLLGPLLHTGQHL